MYSGVISIFSERIKKGLPITVYGDGCQTRDFVNVSDVVQANLLAMGFQSPQTSNFKPQTASFAVFNVATGTQTSLLQLLDTLGELCGKKPEVSFKAVRLSDIKHSLADVSNALRQLGYEPQVDLKLGLTDLSRGN